MSKENRNMLIGAFGWMEDKANGIELSQEQNAFLGRLLERATELAGIGRLTKVKAALTGVSVTVKGKVGYAAQAKRVDWRDGILHAAVAVADMQAIGMAGMTLNVDALCVDWNRKQSELKEARDKEAAEASKEAAK